MNKNKLSGAFTLIEIMVGILIVSTVIIGGFKALSSVTIGKSRIIQQTNTQKESFYFTEKLFEMIKKGGIIDYEEYFNRKVIGNTSYSTGNFDINSGYGNFGRNGNVGTSTYGKGFYECISGNNDKMTGTGCVTKYNSGTIDYTGIQQRYGEYSFQFIDYNANSDNDLGDEDGDGFIKGDDDDEYIGNGPNVFTGGTNLTELYLISGNKKERTFFRWKVELDSNAPASATCNVNSLSNIITGTGCIGTVEYLKLDGVDWGMGHGESGNTYLDGVIDTWLINKDFTGGSNIIAGQNNTNYWIPLFPDSINVTEFTVLGYPSKDINLAWKNSNFNLNISPYIELKVKIKPSWKSRKLIKGAGKELDFSMTINLTDIYSQ